MAIEIRLRGSQYPFAVYSEAWIASEARRLGIEEKTMLDAVLAFKKEVEEKYDFNDVCNPDKQVPSLYEFLPTIEVETKPYKDEASIAAQKVVEENYVNRRDLGRKLARMIQEQEKLKIK